MRRLFTQLIDILFPITCISCGATGLDICSSCITSLRLPKQQNYPWITSLGNYHDPIITALMWHIKRYPNARASHLLAKNFGAMIANRPEHPESWILVPIPISNQRFRERGYNQSVLLAHSLGNQFTITVQNVLVKIHHTKKQGTAASKEERRENITGSFGVYKKSQEIILGKNCILIDDITTTGSTLLEARAVLMRAGANKVLAWTIAN